MKNELLPLLINLQSGNELKRENSVLVADLDLAAVIEACFDFDVCGRYACPDVFALLVDEQLGNDTSPGHL